MMLVVLIAIIGTVSAKFIWLPLSIQAGAVASIYVAVGMIYKCKGMKLSDLLYRKAVVLSCSFICILYLGISYYFNNVLTLVRALYPLGIFNYIGSMAGIIVVLVASYMVLNKIPIIDPLLAWFGKNTLIVRCFYLIEMVAFPFQSVIDFGLSIVEIKVYGLSIILTFITKVLWCCFCIWIVHNSIIFRMFFILHNRYNQLTRCIKCKL